MVFIFNWLFELKARAEMITSTRVVQVASVLSVLAGLADCLSGTKPPGMPSTSVLPAFCAAVSDCINRRFCNDPGPEMQNDDCRMINWRVA